jgi:hypothetical protein
MTPPRDLLRGGSRVASRTKSKGSKSTVCSSVNGALVVNGPQTDRPGQRLERFADEPRLPAHTQVDHHPNGPHQRERGWVRAGRYHGAVGNRNTSHRRCTYSRRPSIRKTIVTTMAIITTMAPTPEARSGRLPTSGAADRTAATTQMPSAESATAATV